MKEKQEKILRKVLDWVYSDYIKRTMERAEEELHEFVKVDKKAIIESFEKKKKRN
jgi:hypothetical protein